MHIPRTGILRRLLICASLILLAAWGATGVAVAGEQVEISEFALPCAVGQISPGPDGNLWFTEGPCGKIGRITPAGEIVEFPLAARGYPYFIVAGPDGNLWFSDLGRKAIGRMTTAGDVTLFPTGSDAAPAAITLGPDGNLWFTLFSAVGRITPAGAVTLFPSLQPFVPADTNDIVAGPDGNLWFTGTFSIGYATPAGAITILPITTSKAFSGITAGPDGNLWVLDWDRILRITPAGQATIYPLPTGGWGSLLVGPDGNLWFSLLSYPSSTDYVGRITLAGDVALYPVPERADYLPMDLTLGPDGNFWYTHNLGFDIVVPSPYREGRIGRLRFLSDPPRLAASVSVALVPPPLGADEVLSYAVVATNRGKGAAQETTITLPFDPAGLELLDVTFDRPGAWVSALHNDALIIRTGPLGPQGGRVTGTLRFRRAANAPAAYLSQRLSYTWSDRLAGGAGRSNLPTPGVLGPDHQRPWYPLAVVPADAGPVASSDGPVGATYRASSGVFLPGEPVGLWYNTPAGAVAIDTVWADGEGAVALDFTPEGLAPGYYSVVAHGHWSDFDAVGSFELR